jgi:hypothetical protein
MIHFPTTPDEFCKTHLRCSFGITEAIAAIGGADLLGGLFGIGDAAAATQAANAGKAIASLAAAMAGKSQATIGSTPITIG